MIKRERKEGECVCEREGEINRERGKRERVF